MAQVTGYLHPRYAESLSFYGTIRSLHYSKSHVIERSFKEHRDAIGIYPLFCCQNWQNLSLDLMEAESLVSFVGVTDPFGKYTRDELFMQGFDRVDPYKTHLIADLRDPRVSKHHRYYTRKALESVNVEVGGKVEDWVSLYDELIKRHNITGIQMFSHESFKLQFKVSGLTVFTAKEKGEVVGMHLWYTMNGNAYSHLAASSPRGYELMCAYALHHAAMEHFQGKVRYLDLGAGAGIRGDADDGLTRFKRGWSSMLMPVYLIGAILQPDVYKGLCKDGRKSDYFPAYR